jgi:hypothetical protein
MTITKQYFELQGELLGMAIAGLLYWRLHHVHD